MIMALAMILSLATNVFAAANTAYSITIDSDKPGHVYEAYQIFKGTLEGDVADNDNVPGTEAILTDIAWADGVVSHLEDTAEEVAMKLSNGTLTAQGLIDLIKEGKIELGAADGTSTYNATKQEYVIGKLPAGYYLIKDADVEDPSVVYTEYILEVLEDSTVNPKGTVPEVEKKIKDINDSAEQNIDDKVWQDSADHDVGDIIPYKLEATLSDNLENYEDGYNLVFHDLLSPGLTYQEITSVKIINPDGTEYTLKAQQYQVECNDVEDNTKTTNLIEDSELTVTINNVKALGGKNSCKVVVEYNALLNEDAVLGSLGNPNEVYLTFSRNPYKGNDYGETPRDRVIAFTYKVVVNKVREDGLNADGSTKYVPLSGAEFKLEKWYKTGENDAEGKPVGKWETIDVVKTDAGDVFSFSGLDDGWYCLTETNPPAGYNAIDPIYFNVTAAHDEKSNDPQLTMLTATKTKETGAAVDSGDLGTFEVTHNLAAGSLSTNIVNRAGVELPETGGIGTTIFYAAGALLVLAAVILLITKKRMSIAE